MADKHARDRGAWLRLLEAALDQPHPTPALRAAVLELADKAQRGGPGHCTPRLSRVLDVVVNDGRDRRLTVDVLRRAITDVKSRRGMVRRA